MFLLLIFCYWIDGINSSFEVKFQVVKNNSVIEIPGASSIAKDIALSVSDFRLSSKNISAAESENVSPTEKQQQFHGVVHDSQGKYYIESIQAHMCEISEKTDNYFFENITRKFAEGAVAFIPCLADGIPSPVKSLQRCDSESCVKATRVKDGMVTHDGHVIFERSSRSNSGWYRCSAKNVCGTIETTPIFIEIRKGQPAFPRPARLLSRRTDEFTITYGTDQSSGSVEIRLERKVTPYELWRLNTTKPSYSDEVVFLDAVHDGSDNIYLFYYPFHTDYGSSDELALTGQLNGSVHYGAVTHNNSFVTHFSNTNTRVIADFDTELIKPPEIINPEDEVFNSPKKIILQFRIEKELPKKYNKISNFMCFKDTIKLVNSWKTRISISNYESYRTRITITLSSPLSLDSGYYQCAVKYDVLYISEETFIKIDKPVNVYNPSTSDVTSHSVELHWEAPPDYIGDFVVYLSDHIHDTSTLVTPANFVFLTHLTPYTQYYWYVETTSQQPITDPHTFTTLKDVPIASVGPVSVLRSKTAVQLTWGEYPRTCWFDDQVYFAVNTVGINSTAESSNQTVQINTASVGDLVAATTYTVTVTPCNSVGCSGNHSSLNITTKHSVLETSPGIQILHISKTYVDLTATLNDTSTNEVYLEIFSGGLCHSAPTIPSTPLIHLKTQSRDRLDNLVSFTDYSVRVRATNGYSTSPWSDCVSFKTSFPWWVPVIPVVCVSVLLTLMIVIRALVKSRCPDVINKVKQALEPKYINILQPGDEWETSNEVAIIHKGFEDCDL